MLPSSLLRLQPLRSRAILRPLLFAAVAGVFACLAACGGDSADSVAQDAGKAVATEVRQGVDDARGDDADTDRGEASMEIDGGRWEASSASARKRDSGALAISASANTVAEGKVTGERLSLSIGKYQGPGSYSAQAGSLWARVGIDAAAAQGQDQAAAVTSVLSGASTVRLMFAEIEIESEDAGFISGRFHLPAARSADGKAVNGSFRARVRD